MMQHPTGIDNCASGYLTHSRSDFTPRIPPPDSDDLDASDWAPQRDVATFPNLVVTAANVLEVYVVRIQHDVAKGKLNADSRVLDGVNGANLELVCHYRF